MEKDILIFDIMGYAAHFRKFYTNSSSLTYSVPPRTTLAGLISAILGIERDTYYNNFSVDKVDIAVKKNTKTRKILQSVNYMKITKKSEFEFPQNHTQIPFEMVLGDKGNVSYRIYFSSKDIDIMDELEDRIKTQKCYYTPSLGAAPFNCNVKYIDRVKGEIKDKKDVIKIASIIPINKIENEGIVISEIKMNETMMVKERMTREFKDGREIKSVESYIYDENTNPLPVNLKDKYVKLSYKGIEENILFM